MDEVLLVSLGHTPDAPIDWIQWNRKLERASASGQLANAAQLQLLAERATSVPCYVLVPQEQVLASAVQLPNGSRAALEAIPYQLEEQLCEDPEQLHVAVGAPDTHHRYPVSVISRQLLQQWRELLLAASLPIKGLFADAQALAVADEETVVVGAGERVLIKGAGCPGIALQRQELHSWRPLLAQQGINLESEQVASDRSASGVLELSNNLEQSPLEALAQRVALDLAINLLQGEFKLRDPVRELLTQWQKPLLLALALLVLMLAAVGVDNFRLNQQKAALDAEVVRLYQAAFPDAKRIVNPRLQMERQLEQLRQGQSGAPVLRALELGVTAFRQHPDVTLNGMRYDATAGSLVLELETPEYQQLQQFNQALQTAGLQSQLGQFSRVDQRVRGQVTLQEVR